LSYNLVNAFESVLISQELSNNNNKIGLVERHVAMSISQGVKEAVSPTILSAVTTGLENAIVRGDFPPGCALREVHLASRFNTSRGTIREALRVLSEQGLVEVHARRGAVVPQLSPQRAREIFSLRAILESFAVKLALTEGRIRDVERDQIQRAFDHMRRCINADDVAALIEADMAFHWTICSPCGHSLLLDHLRKLQAGTRQFILYTKFYDSDAESEVESHAPLLRTVLQNEADRAELAMREHITTAGERLLLKMLSNNLEITERMRRRRSS
jgi:DNA-binding GntR family transcriptional regulator